MTPATNRRILVVDDMPSIHEDFRKVLGKDATEATDLHRASAEIFGPSPTTANARPSFDVTCVSQGQDAVPVVTQSLVENRPFALAFIDIRMPPGWDGIQTLERLWAIDPNLQVVICSAHSDYSLDQILQRVGYTDRLLILKKPFDNVEVTQLAIAMSHKWELAQQSRQRFDTLEQAVAARDQDVVDTRDVAVFALAKLAESRDPETGQHLERIRCYCRILADELRLHGPFTHLIDKRWVDDLYRSSPLHDIGKVGIPDAILLKPGRLSEREFAILKKHTLIGAGALERAAAHGGCGGFLRMAADIARHHHERYDGTGYPSGLKGDQIPLSARIVALADVYDALTSVRVYKAAFDPEVARLMIEEQSGKHFDPAVVAAFRTRYEDFLRMQEQLDHGIADDTASHAELECV